MQNHENRSDAQRNPNRRSLFHFLQEKYETVEALPSSLVPLTHSTDNRVHPHDKPPVSGESQRTSSPEHGVPRNPTSPAPAKPVPPPQGKTYVIRITKGQVYRVPPPENARCQRYYVRRKSRRCSRCCCLCSVIGLIFILIVLLAIAICILILVFRPTGPYYTIDSIVVKGVNLTSVAAASSVMSPEFNVTVRVDNSNNKIGFYYLKDSSVEVHYKDVMLCNGMLPAFYQPSNNTTVFQTVLKGSNIELTTTDVNVTDLVVNAQSNQTVPLTLNLRVPVKIKVGSVKTWKITVRVDCNVVVANLTAKAKVLWNSCGNSYQWL